MKKVLIRLAREDDNIAMFLNVADDKVESLKEDLKEVTDKSYEMDWIDYDKCAEKEDANIKAAIEKNGCKIIIPDEEIII